MLWYSLEAPRRGASDEYHTIFYGEIIKYYATTPSYLEVGLMSRKPYLWQMLVLTH